MSSFAQKLAAWMSTGSSVMGAAVGTPAFAAAATGQITWAQAAPFLLGSAISILLPETSPPPAQANAGPNASAGPAVMGVPVAQAMQLASLVSQAVSPAPAPVLSPPPSPVMMSLAALNDYVDARVAQQQRALSAPVVSPVVSPVSAPVPALPVSP